MQCASRQLDDDTLTGPVVSGRNDQAGKLAIGRQAVQEDGAAFLGVGTQHIDDTDLRRHQLQADFQAYLRGRNTTYQANVNLARLARLQSDDVAGPERFLLALDEAQAEAIRAFVDQRPFAGGEIAPIVATGSID